MAKRKISKYVFEPGVSKDDNLYPYAVSLLTSNKAFLQAQVVAFIDYQIANNIAPYAGYTYASAKCLRDVGLIIDAAIHDIKYGGNVKIRQVSDYFHIDGEPMIRGDVSPETTAQAYLRDTINNYIFTNTAVAPAYGQVAVSQIFTANNAEAGASARNTTLWNIVSTVITNGPTAMPAKVPGVSSLRLLGNFTPSEILLITDTQNGIVLYNFADPANAITFEYKTGRSSGNGELLSDLDYPAWWHTTDTITTVYLSESTSTLATNSDLQIFVEEPYQTIKPWDFGTDAIERIRTSQPQAMLDADFEYGLQPTKWQAIGQIRSYPSLYELPGTDLSVTSVTTDASASTGGFGSSLISVTTSGTHGLSVGQPITVKGLSSTVAGFARAEGSFLVTQITSAVSFTYYSSAKVGTSTGQSLTTSFVQIRSAQYYTGANIGSPVYSVVSNGSSSTITTLFSASAGSFSFAFSGSSGSIEPGDPVSGFASIPQGTSVSGLIGTTTVTAFLGNDAAAVDTNITLVSAAGVQQGMVIDNGSGTARTISSIVGNTLFLSGAVGQTYDGSNGSDTGVTGTIVQSIGTNARFDVSITSGIYTVTNPEDSTANGQNFAVGDVVKILGTDLGGASPGDDITIVIDQVDSGGSIVAFSPTGTSTAINNVYLGVSAVTQTLTGAGAVFTVTRTSGLYSASATTLGSGYKVGNRIVVAGTSLSGTSPTNDATITVVSINGTGGITNATADGTTIVGDPISIYPVINISEALTGTLPASSVINVGAIATIQVDFASNHGLIPGTPMFNQITSTPAPAFSTSNRTLPASSAWSSVAFGNGYFVAIQNGSNNTAFSTNGTTWSIGGVLPSSGSWTSIAYGRISEIDYFVAVQSGGTAAAYSTNNGATWTSSTLPSSGTWTSVAFYNNVFVSVRSGSTAGAYSTNGTTWTASTLPSSSSWTDVEGGLVGTSSIFLAISSGGTAAAYSVDNGVTWAATGALPGSVDWRSLAFGNNRFFAVARGSTTGAISTNGVTWTLTTLPSAGNWNSVVYGDDNFFVVADSSTDALTSFTAETGSFTARTLAGVATWEEVAYGYFVSSGGIFAIVGNTTSANSVVLTSANHQLAAGPFVITQVPSLTSARYPARTTGIIDTATPITGQIYVRPDAFFVHRPFDGGVQLGTGGPAHAAQAIRQSKKYIRYQSGKGMFYNTGALFAPSYNLQSGIALGAELNSIITFTCDDNDHGLQPGAVVEVIGCVSFEYNGEYIVEAIVDSRSFQVRAIAVLSSLTAQLGEESKVVLKRWHGATVRIGTFDEQNGLFYQYDGQTLAVTRRSSTDQLTGTVAMATESNIVTGTNTRFSEQLIVGDKVVIRGMSHSVTGITSNTSMTVSPDWRGANSISGARICKTSDLVFPQSEWNIDPLDGTGPSGYNILPWRMQMIAIQYTWYAVGFIEFHLRGPDGKFVFFHRIRNSNVNTEAYMRTANLPVRYEVENTSARGKLKNSITGVSTSITLINAEQFPSSGIVYIDNELIAYTSKSGDTLGGLTRSATMTNFSAGQNRSYTAGTAASHTAGVGVLLVSNTCSPTISHWGSALITDGNFDQDRGYLFNYTATGISASLNKQTAFMIRLAPSVSNALVGDLGERDLLNRAQLLLKDIAITADTTASAGALVVEGVLNPRNYPSNPANILWNGLSSQGAGGQPSFCQVALGGSINWGGIPLTTTTATISGAVTAGSTARAFSNSTQTITAQNNPSGVGSSITPALSTSRNTFFITNSSYDALSTPLRVGDVLSEGTYLNSGQVISDITRAFNSSNFTRITMNTVANNNSPFFGGGQNVNITVSSIYRITFSNAYNLGRNTIALTQNDINGLRLQVGDFITNASFLGTGRTVSNITNSAFVISGTTYGIITMNANAASTSGAASDQAVTFQIPQTAASYASTNYIFFTLSSWSASGAGVGTRVASSFTQFPAGTSIAASTNRQLGSTTVVRTTFTQSSSATLASGASVTFEFGDVQYALPGEQVFAFVANPGGTVNLDLAELKELTTTAIGGRGTFPNGPDVLAINVYKIAGSAVPTSIVLRWGEAQA